MHLRLIARVLLILTSAALAPRAAASQTLPPVPVGAYLLSPMPNGWAVLDPADPLYPLRSLNTGCRITCTRPIMGETLMTRSGDLIELVNYDYGSHAARTDVQFVRSPLSFSLALPFASVSSVETRSGTILVFGAAGDIAELDFARQTVEVKSFRLEDAAPNVAVDLAADSCTLFYTGATSVRRFDVCGGHALGAIEVGASPGGLRILPDASLLVALPDRIERLDSAGALLRTYDHSAIPQWSAVALNPDGQSFIAGGDSTIVEFDLNTGDPIAVRETTFLGRPLRLGVFGEPRAAAVAAVPAIGSSITLAIALALLALFALR